MRYLVRAVVTIHARIGQINRRAHDSSNPLSQARRDTFIQLSFFFSSSAHGSYQHKQYKRFVSFYYYYYYVQTVILQLVQTIQSLWLQWQVATEVVSLNNRMHVQQSRLSLAQCTPTRLTVYCTVLGTGQRVHCHNVHCALRERIRTNKLIPGVETTLTDILVVFPLMQLAIAIDGFLYLS